MKAFIFNSGLGSRLGNLTKNKPKSMVRLGSGETIFHRQLRVLHACGIREFIVTTGPFPELLASEARPFAEAGCTVSFVPNPAYEETNYIYSMHLARHLLRGDFIMLHGDLVFDAAYAQAVVDSSLPSLGSVNPALPLPEKDFKARVTSGEISEVSVSMSDGGCVAFQPFYKLSEEAMATWLQEVGRFVHAGRVGVYAEDAANEVFESMHVAAFSYEGHCVEEIDTPEDLSRVSAEIRLHDFAQQPIYRVDGGRAELIDGFAPASLSTGEADGVAGVLSALGCRRPLVVTAPFFPTLSIAGVLGTSEACCTEFSDFAPNPTYGDVHRALGMFKAGGCDSLISVGGGSAIDVAKCVKQFLTMPKDSNGRDLQSPDLPYAGVPHVAVPTTAGTGSESTHFAVCYVDDDKMSVANDCLLPDAVLLDPSNLAGLPVYQKKCTMLDALCQAIESYWSLKSSEESRAYSAKAIAAIMENAPAYLEVGLGSADACEPEERQGRGMEAAANMLRAANRAGKAINLTTTTGPHAMSYKLTSLYGIPHGHAVALCMPGCWQLLIERGDEGLQRLLAEIATLILGDSKASPDDGLQSFVGLFASLGIALEVAGKAGDINLLASSVNTQRLSNFPVAMSSNDIENIYREIVIEEHAPGPFQFIR